MAIAPLTLLPESNVIHRSALMLMLLPGLLAAQQSTGRLEGRVLDSAGTGLEQVEIVVTGTGLPQARLAVSNSRGFYRLEDLPVGSYSVGVRRIGYRSVIVTGLSVRLAETATVPTQQLAPHALELPELTISADAPLLDFASAAGGGTISAERIEGLPVERSYQELPALLPNVIPRSEGLNIGGATGLENQFFIDGANVTDSYRGMSSTILPYNFIQDVHVRTGGYEAEHRGALGGVVDVVTRSGGERWSGQLFGYFLNNRLTAESRTVAGGNAGQGFTRYDVGMSLGGPVVRNRLWFFAAYNPSVDREDVRLAGLGVRTDHATRHSFAGKLTWQPGSRTTIVTSVLGDPTSRTGIGATFSAWPPPSGFANADPWLGRLRSGGISVSSQAAHTISDRLHLTGTLAWSRLREDNGPLTTRGPTEGLFIDSVNIWSAGYPDDIRLQSHRFAATLSAALSAGAHQLKMGVEYGEQRLNQYQQTHAIIQISDTNYAIVEYLSDGPVRSRLPSAYLQDGWAVTPRLRMNAGLRWDGQYLYGSDGHRSLTITDQWQPRLGVVWQADHEGQGRLWGSYGRFYQDLHNSAGSTHYAYGTQADFLSCRTDPRVDRSGCGTPFPRVARVPDPGLEGQGFDEFSLGYERAVTSALRARARLVHRRLRWGIENAVDTAGNYVLGNPGRGAMVNLPRMRRDYDALEFALEGNVTPRLYLLASYVVSRNYGNHSGLYYADFGVPFPNTTGAFDIPEILVGATGRLPNDVPHVLKLHASYAFSFGLGVGTALSWQSGTPISELGALYQSFYNKFLTPRGTAGRTPGIWDLGIRVRYAFDRLVGRGLRPTAMLDVYHVGSPRHALSVDQLHFTEADAAGLQSNPNPNYLQPTSFQPPMSARLGLVVEF